MHRMLSFSPFAAVLIALLIVLSITSTESAVQGEAQTAGQVPIDVTPASIGWPSWSGHGVEHVVPFVLHNPSTEVFRYSVRVVYLNAPTGWLEISGWGYQLDPEASRTGTVVLNPSGAINEPGTVVYLRGGIEFLHTFPGNPDTILIDHWIADTLIESSFDTISTGVISLVVGSNGNYGNLGQDSVSMDFHETDCDSTATVYLYDGGPVIGWIDGADTVMNWSIYGEDSSGEHGFVPISHVPRSTEVGVWRGVWEYYAADFMTGDSSVGVTREWYAPVGGFDEDVEVGNYIIMKTEVYLLKDVPRTLVIGEIVDWNIPSDSGANNGSGFDDTRGLIWQFGGEYNQDDTTECQENEARFGGFGYIEGDQYGLSAYTAAFDFATDDLLPGHLYDSMIHSVAFETFSSTNPDSALVDLYSVMVFTKEAALQIDQRLEFVTVLISVENDYSREVQSLYDDAYYVWWDIDFSGWSTCTGAMRGDMNGDMINADPADLAYLIDYLFNDGLPVNMFDEGDLNGDGISADPVDLAYFVDFLYNGGPAPLPCP